MQARFVRYALEANPVERLIAHKRGSDFCASRRAGASDASAPRREPFLRGSVKRTVDR